MLRTARSLVSHVNLDLEICRGLLLLGTKLITDRLCDYCCDREQEFNILILGVIRVNLPVSDCVDLVTSHRQLFRNSKKAFTCPTPLPTPHMGLGLDNNGHSEALIF